MVRARPVLAAGLGLALVAAVLLAFRGVVANGFVNWDDELYVANPQLRSLGQDSLLWMLTARYPQWQPLTWLSHALDNVLWGASPASHHATSLALHALVVLLLALLFSALLGAALPETAKLQPGLALASAAVAAALFGLHPLRVESVAWISARKDLLCALFFIAATLAWLRYLWAESPRARRIAYLSAALLFAAALASKPTAVSFAAVLLILDAHPALGRSPAPWPGRVLTEKLPFFAAALALSLATASPEPGRPLESWKDPRTGEAAPGWPAPTRLERWARIGLAVASYPVKTLWPAHLVPYYPEAEPDPAVELGIGAACLALLASCGLAWRRGLVSWPLAWLAYGAMIAPVSGIVLLAGPSVADRFSYLPTTSLLALVAGGLVWLGARAERRRALLPAFAACVLGLVVLGILTARQVAVWRDSESLWTAVIDAYPDRVAQAYANLGGFHHQQAAARQDRALLGRAEQEYRKAVDVLARQREAFFPIVHNNLGRLYQDEGDPARAEQYFQLALKIAPNYLRARVNLARLLFLEGRLDEAIRECRKVQRWNDLTCEPAALERASR